MRSAYHIVFACLAIVLPAMAEDERLAGFLSKFPEADANNDGILTPEEALAYRETMSAARPKPSERPKEASAEGRRYTSQELAQRFEAKEFQGLPYRFFRPEIEEGRTYPLVLSLHGAGGRGDDNLRSLKSWNGTLTEPELQERHPCFVVTPQSKGAWRVAGSEPRITPELIETFPEVWKEVAEKRKTFVTPVPGGVLGTVFELLDELAAEHPIDPDRVYVLGHSMGGFGSFECLAMEPDRFAAAIPSAGGLSPWHDPAVFREVPVWAFHGDKDTTVIPELTEAVFDRLEEVGGNMKFTVLGGVGHGAAAFAFSYEGDAMDPDFVTKTTSDACDPTENVWDWLFAQRRKR